MAADSLGLEVVPGGGIESSHSKGDLKIPSMLGNFNADAGLRLVPPNSSKTASGQFRVIWGDFGTCFTGKS
jgi:hypothetical protein